jgi:Alpha/beta hydrolase domain
MAGRFDANVHLIRAALMAVLAIGGGLLAEPAAASSVPTPTVSLPPVGQHGFPFLSEVIDLANYGYVEEEVFIEGTARSYVPVAPLAGITDGRWDATPTGPTASYKTRLLIRRPTNPSKFNGIVFIDWMNVTAGNDSDIFGGLSSELLNEGYAYVGVSAQAVGVNYLRNTWETGPGARYASLVHPGDSYSYDIFSQAAQAIVAPKKGGPAPLGNLTKHVDLLVAEGASQSGARLITYINAVQPDAGVIDAFLPLLANNGSALSQSPLPAVPVPSGANWQYRTDSDVPVLHVNSETEFVASARAIHSKPDTDRFRLWEIAGSAHATRPASKGPMPSA